MRYKRNPLLMTVIGNPGKSYQPNPHVIIDSSDLSVLGIERGHPMHTFEKAYKKATEIAQRLGRNIHVVAHPGVPKWMKRGTRVTGIFLAMGPYVTVTPDGQWISQRNPGRVRRNPGFGASLAGSLAGGLIARAISNPGPRTQKSAEKALDHAIGQAWARHMSGVQVPIMDIPRIFRDIKLEIAAGAPLDHAVMTVGGRYRVNRNPLTRGEAADALRSAYRDMRYARKPVKGDADRDAKRFYAGRATGKAIVAKLHGPASAEARAEKIMQRGYTTGMAAMNPGPRGKRRIVMTIQQFANWVKAKRDPTMWRAFLAKFKGYEKWTHGARSRKVTLEWQEVPGMSGLWITYDGGKQPESTYIMPHGSPRKGAWKHPWGTMPDIKHDPEAGVVLTKLRGKSRITDFYHK